MIHVIAAIEISPGKRDQFLDIFRQLVPKVQAEDGCIEYGPAVDCPTDIELQEPVRENVVTVIEKWESVEALKKHLAAPHMEEYRQAVQDLVTGVQIYILEPA
ncbi:MAG: antibiotic biosynthesis monooxygenase [Planctomycetes bacterium]|nr:antibiotic biosynthesis monooxygenase [Planctomycetota bacterium]